MQKAFLSRFGEVRVLDCVECVAGVEPLVGSDMKSNGDTLHSDQDRGSGGRQRHDRSALTSSLLVYGSRLISSISQAAALVLLARTIVPEELGVVTVVIATVTAIGVVADAGLEAGASRISAVGETGTARRMISLHRTTTAIAGWLLLLIGTALAGGSVAWFDPALIAVGVWVVVERRSSLRVSVNIALGRCVRASVGIAASKVLALGVLVCLSSLELLTPVMRYMVFLFLGACIMWLVVPLPDGLGGIQERKLGWRQLLREVRPFWITSLTGQVRSLDSLMVSLSAGPAAAGLYAFPSRAVGPLRLVATSMGAVAMPTAARGQTRQIRSLESGMWLLTGLFCIATVSFWLAGDVVLTWALGPAYADSAKVLTILMVGVAANIPGAVWSAVLQGSGRADLVAKVGMILSTLFLPLVAAGAAFAGAVGAAAGVSTTLVVQFLCMLWLRGVVSGEEMT